MFRPGIPTSRSSARKCPQPISLDAAGTRLLPGVPQPLQPCWVAAQVCNHEVGQKLARMFSSRMPQLALGLARGRSRCARVPAGGFFPAPSGWPRDCCASCSSLGSRSLIGHLRAGVQRSPSRPACLPCSRCGLWRPPVVEFARPGLDRVRSRAPLPARVRLPRLASRERPGICRSIFRWVGLAMAVTCAVALATRLLPTTFPTSAGVNNERLAFPLTYWNAMGMFCGLGAILLTHLTASEREPAAVRVAAAAGAAGRRGDALLHVLARRHRRRDRRPRPLHGARPPARAAGRAARGRAAGRVRAPARVRGRAARPRPLRRGRRREQARGCSWW